MDYVNPDEVFALACRIEGNAADFYRTAAAQHADNQQAAYLGDLAEVEEQHKSTFAGMRERASVAREARTTAELQPDGALFMASIAEGFPVEGSPTAAEFLTGDESLADILGLGIDLEKESILFYLGLRDIVVDPAGQEAVTGIIAQEKHHLVELTRRMKELKD